MVLGFLDSVKESIANLGNKDKNITGALSTADTFTERFFGQSNYKVGS